MRKPLDKEVPKKREKKSSREKGTKKKSYLSGERKG